MSTQATDKGSVKPRPRKPRPKPARAVRVILHPDPADAERWMAVQITVGKETAVYLLHPIPADFGQGFQVEKLDEQQNTVEAYDVNLMGRESSCTCKGCTFTGHCKHIDCLTTLNAQQKLPHAEHRSPSAMAKNDPEAFTAHMDAVAADPWDCPEADQRYEPIDDAQSVEEAAYFQQDADAPPF